MNISSTHCWENSYPDGLRWDLPIEPISLPTMLHRTVERHRDRHAIDYRDHLISYAALGRAVEGFAAALIARAGVGPGTPLALYLPNSPYHPVGFFGGAKAGARLAHLSPLDAERELVHKLQDSGARILFTTNLPPLLPMALRLLDTGKIDLLIVGEDEAWGPAAVPHLAIPDRPGVVSYRRFTADAPLPAAWPAPAADDIALLQYTSGTTGKPKGAILTHGNLTAAVQIYNAWFGAQERALGGDTQHRVICVLPLFHIYALTAVLLRQLDAGALILLRPRFDVETVLRDIEVKRATIFPGVPTMWIALANHPGIEQRDLSSLVYCGSGGAPLPVEVATRFAKQAGLKLRGGWGMTETASPGTALPLEGPDKPGTIGLPLPGITMEVVSLLDPTQVLAVGETGELRIKGPNVTQGYWQQPDATAASFTDGGLLTGDIGYMDADGYLFIVDRKKDLIISGGFNVYPQMIEQAIYEHPHIEEALVIGIPDAYRGEAAKAFIKLRDGAPDLTIEDLRLFLADKLGRHELPVALEIRPALPRTAVGKLSKKELRAP
ncbi:MAG: pimA [Rhodospirillales bacterium]|nr:pimA [Rhodospirillales bacterium]